MDGGASPTPHPTGAPEQAADFYVKFAKLARQLTPGEAVLAGSGNRRHVRGDGSKVPWFFGNDGAALAEQLEDAGLLGDSPQQPEVEA